MKYPADNYDLSGLITACSKMTPAGLTYNVVGVDHGYRCASGGEGHDYVKDQILNHDAGVFLFCPLPLDDAATAPPSQARAENLATSDDCDGFGIYAVRSSWEIQLFPSRYDRTSGEISPLESRRLFDVWDEDERSPAQQIWDNHLQDVVLSSPSEEFSKRMQKSMEELIKSFAINVDNSERTFSDRSARIIAVSFSSDGKYAFSGDEDGRLAKWDIATGQCAYAATTLDEDEIVRSVSFSPDGTHALLGSGRKTLRLWNIASGECGRTLTVGRISAMAFSPAGTHALLGCDDNTLGLWNIVTGEFERVLAGHDREVSSISFSPDGQYALSGSKDRTLRLWDLVTGECERTFTGHDNVIHSVSLSPDGRRALSGSRDKTLKLWNIATGECERTFLGHTNQVFSVSFSPDGRQVLSGSGDWTLKMWDIETGECCHTFLGHSHSVHSAAISPDGRYALSGDGALKLWKLP